MKKTSPAQIGLKTRHCEISVTVPENVATSFIERLIEAHMKAIEQEIEFARSQAKGSK